MPSQTLLHRRTELSAHLVAFCRYLREQDYSIGPGEEADALRAIQVIQAFEAPETFFLCLQSVLCKSLRQQIHFKEHYNKYWKELAKAVDSKVKDVEENSSKKGRQKEQGKKQKAPSLQALKSWLYGEANQEETELAAYSPGAGGGGKDFSGFSESGLQEVVKIIHLLAHSLANQYSRRYRKSKVPGRFDVRKTLRHNMRSGGEIMQLHFQKLQKQKLQLILLCDVSKSMDLYSRFLVQFLYAFQNNYRQIETFVFSTSLQRISRELQKGDFEDILEQLSDKVPNWSGGTRIGASLHQFLEVYAGKHLNHRSIVLMMSDGWDTGEVDLLADSMRQLQRKAGRVIWLNPLAGRPGYRPEVKGMQAAMPFIDVFAPAHNLESLREVVKMLKTKKRKKLNATNQKT